jgi:Uma2 family endonuclease
LRGGTGVALVIESSVGVAASPQARRVSWDDIKAVPADGRSWEILDGELLVSPAPTWWHQQIVVELLVALREHVRRHAPGKVNVAPVDVVFDPHNVAEPDILFVSDERLRIIRDRVWGAPDLCVEVLSPSSVTRDRGAKRAVYARFDVREYWIVDPDAETVEVCGGPGLPLVATYAASDRLRSPLLPDLDLPLAPIFAA